MSQQAIKSKVSLVGIVRKMVPSVTNVKYLIDDMTGPPLYVKQWVDTEDPGVESTLVYPGRYVRVSGSLRSVEGLRSLLALKVRCLVDLNEITSHMLEVVQAHMQFAEETVGMVWRLLGLI
ncbi:replication protein A 32 kDa subunit-like [Aplochiton taeniatus]